MHQKNPDAASQAGHASAKARLPNKKARAAWGKTLAAARWGGVPASKMSTKQGKEKRGKSRAQ